MNQSQLKYARERAEKIKREKLAALANDPRFKGITMSTKERLRALQSGEFAVKPKVSGPECYLGSFLTFNGETPADTKGKDREVQAIEKAHAALLDKLYLGDAEEALALLEAFQA